MNSVSPPGGKKGVDKLVGGRCIVFVDVTWCATVDADCIAADVVGMGNDAHIAVSVSG